ncbi:DNA-binding protein [Aliidongia dinghuensis]|uniref:DNA-binding protein n=1 Tax=Aliidongia dinghuensis TaxID=1867774 RepID=A0A8J2YWG4_9PROT|nr:cold shock domain-containing protein [Aliidongia dinghuensis]GGF25685.1 DNA-binding protein [Aliidongia dinghuensis]
MYERRPGFFRNEDPPSGRRVDAKVKWFNASKGFGFVTPADGTQDAFLPMATLRRAGFEDVSEGASLVCEIGEGAKGPLVVSVIDVDLTTAVPQSGSRGHDRDAPQTPSGSLDGSVKWFEPGKGYGFISPDGGGKDIFIHITALRRSGLQGLDPGVRVRVDVVDGKKGLEAFGVTII